MVVRPPAGADPRGAYLAKLAALLWPAPADPVLRRGGEGGYLLVPSAARPRLLLPTGRPEVAAGAIRYATEATGRRARLRRKLLAAAFRTGIGPLAFRDRLFVGPGPGALETHLAGLLGQPVLLSAHIGPARANRKPVLQLHSPDGRTIGYAKLGVDPLTRALVDTEAAALRRLAGLRPLGVLVADVLHHGHWGSHALLISSALPVGLPRAAPEVAAATERAAMRTVSAYLGIRRESYASCGYARRLAAAVDTLGDRPQAGPLRTALAAVTSADPSLVFGAWHGDWNGGNSAVLADGRVLLWDWERFDPDVPAGYDALHRRLQTEITRKGVAPRSAARGLLAGAAATLAPFDQPAGVADLVAILYLVELATRYLRDRQAEAGARLGRVDTWLLPAVAERLAGRTG